MNSITMSLYHFSDNFWFELIASICMPYVEKRDKSVNFIRFFTVQSPAIHQIQYVLNNRLYFISNSSFSSGCISLYLSFFIVALYLNLC